MSQSDNDKIGQDEFKSAVTITVLGVAGLTLLVIFAALFLGLWLDKILNTRPIFTVGLMLASIPVTLVLMFRVVKIATRRIKPGGTKSPEEETQRGTGT